MSKEELLKGLSKEQLEKARECKTNEELLELAKEEGVELTDEQLAAVSGGAICEQKPAVCPMCGSTNIKAEDSPTSDHNEDCECLDCGWFFKR